MSGNNNNFQSCTINFGNVNGDQMNGGQMNGGQTNGGQLNSSQSVGGNMNGDQINSGQLNADPNLVGRTNAGPSSGGRTTAGPSPGGGTNGGPCPEGGANARPSTRDRTNARQSTRRRRNARPSTRGRTNAGQMIIARDLTINHSENASCWVWVNDPSETRFTEVAELLGDKLLSIKATKNFVGLLAETKYDAYLIFKTKRHSKCLSDVQKAIIVKSDSMRDELRSDVCLKPPPTVMRPSIEMPVERSDGWMELKLGQFYCSKAISNNYVVISIEDTNTDNEKTGLIIAGFEIRPIETAKDEGGSNCFAVLSLILLILYVSWFLEFLIKGISVFY